MPISALRDGRSEEQKRLFALSPLKIGSIPGAKKALGSYFCGKKHFGGLQSPNL